ncbi:MAG TPA: MEDS domain-containing protein [Mycobacterium sp.]|nr:MEDS domain-containing protein [Mycobacterium sp.]
MKRSQGVVSSASGLVPFGHLGWGYRSRSEFLARASEYIADGVARNQWVEYVGDGSRDQLWSELATMPGVAGRDEGIGVMPVTEFYGVPDGSDVVDPAVAVTARIQAVHDAIAAGYTGFRAVSDATAVARRPGQRQAFAQFEFLIDQQMAVLPVSALCAFDTTQLGQHAAELICLHPFTNEGMSCFRLYAEPGFRFSIAGYLDVASDELFTTTLQRIWSLETDELAVIDTANLEFISPRQLSVLDRLAAAADCHVALRTDQRVVGRLAALLGATHVAVQPPAAAPDA